MRIVFLFLFKIFPVGISLRMIEIFVYLKIARLYHLNFYYTNCSVNKKNIGNYCKNKFPDSQLSKDLRKAEERESQEIVRSKVANFLKDGKLIPYSDLIKALGLEDRPEVLLNLCLAHSSKYPSTTILSKGFDISLKLEREQDMKIFLGKIKFFFYDTLLHLCSTIRFFIYANKFTPVEDFQDSFIRLVRSGKNQELIRSSLVKFSESGKAKDIYGLINYFLSYYPEDQRILRLKGDLHKSDGNVELSASAYLLLALYDKDYAYSKLISLYSDSGNYASALPYLSHLVAELSFTEYSRILPMLLRVAPFFPEYQESLFSMRDSYITQIKSFQRPTSVDLNTVIRMKDWSTALLLSKTREQEDFSDLFGLTERFFDYSNAALCNDNMKKIHLIAADGVFVSDIEGVEKLSRENKLIEIFIPTVFYNTESEQKEIYGNIRNAFLKIFDKLGEMKGFYILPRIQYNWRHVDPISSGYLICYHSILSGMQRGIVIQESTFKNRVSFDGKGYAGFSGFAKNVNLSSEDENDFPIVDQFISEYLSNQHSKYPQSNEEFDISSPYIFFPLQVETDIVTGLRNLDVYSVLRKVSSFASSNNLKLIVKRHPYCSSMKLKSAVNDLLANDHVVESSASIHRLIGGADLVLTANSGVGLESLLYDKPVITFGGSDYEKAVMYAKSSEDLDTYLSTYNEFNTANYKKFIFEYITKYTVDVTNFSDLDDFVEAQLCSIVTSG